jgi:hypothetical protein
MREGQARRRTNTVLKEGQKKTGGCFLLVGNKQAATQKAHVRTSRELRRDQKGHPKEFAFARKQKKKKKGRQQQETQKTLQKIGHPYPG